MEYPPKSTFRQIDPGPRPRRQKTLCCSSILGRAFLLLLFISLAWFFYRPILNLFGLFSMPHSTLYQDRNKPYQPQDVVRPLIDSNQTFDIVATVWLRSELVDPNRTETSELELNEQVIFSETVFTGLQLKDKSKKNSVNFKVPTEVFKRKDLNNYDLRASFVLMPQSSSLLDSAVSYTNWKPDAAKYPRMRPWADPKFRSLEEEIVDSYGTFIPLLSFNNIQSRCPNVIIDDEGEENQSDEVLPYLFSDYEESRESYTSTKGKPVLQSHPYIITRSYLRIVDVTELYNRESYEHAHEKLKSNSCGLPDRPDWRECKRSFSHNGNQEVEIKVSRKDDESGETRIEYAYAPYLSLSRKAWGPLDLVPVPVNRQDCSGSSSAQATDSQIMSDEEFISITWNIAFSGRTPRKFKVAEWAGSVVPPMESLNMTDTDVHVPIQWIVEQADGVAGHQHRDGYHPRRVLILNILTFVFNILDSILAILYWYTRSSTVGLSTLGVKLVSLGIISNYLVIFIFAILRADQSIVQSVIFCVWNAIFFIKPLLMLKAATRAEFYRYKRWIPAIRFAPETHGERSSQRVDGKTSWRVKILMYSLLATVFFIRHYQNTYIINPVNPRTPSSDNLRRRLDVLRTLTTEPALITGWVLQIILNFRTKRFAGMYALGSYLNALSWIFRLADKSKMLVGTSLNSGSLDYFDFVEGVCYVVLAYQALRYPKISPADIDEDSQ